MIHRSDRLQTEQGESMQNNRNRKQKVRPVFVICILVIAAAAGVLIWLFARTGGNTGTVPEASGADTPSADVVWQGRNYNYNDHLSNFLFIGVDTREKETADPGSAQAGQADALYLLSWDRVNGDITVITIPRDTMTQIQVLGPGDESLGKTEDHISLSYAYGDGGHESCTLAEEAVSELFYGLPVQGYCSINMDALPVLTDSVGGVTVTVPNDSLEKVDGRFAEGAQVTLDGGDTETFVRYRDTSVSQSALSRTERQQAYIQAFGQAAGAAYTADPAFVTDLYEALEPYMVTNMGNDQFASILDSLASGSRTENWTVPGKGVSEASYDEYHVEDDALYEKIIETFYQPEEE